MNRKANIILSALAIVVLISDFLVFNDLRMESVGMAGISFLLLFNIMRQVARPLKDYRIIHVIVNLLVIACGGWCMMILLLLSFGHGFAGGGQASYPYVLNISIVLDLALMLSALIQIPSKAHPTEAE